ncbi:MAG: alpha/beta hydrolase [Planctomycetes bacterium]|nr:alpha/beta hydrolase [Planctomycetota bacterium]
MIAGERDSYVVPSVPERFCRRVSGNADSLWVVPNAKHNGARKVEPEEYDRRLVQFFSILTPETSRCEISQPQSQAGG